MPYYIQLDKGLIVTGMRDYVSWGMYISNFVFFVATSLVGMLISAATWNDGVQMGQAHWPYRRDYRGSLFRGCRSGDRFRYGAP